MSIHTDLREHEGAVSVAGMAVASARHELRETQKAMGRTIRLARLHHGVSLRALAREVKCAAPTLSDIELGRRWSGRIVRDALRALHEREGSSAAGRGAR